MRAFGGSFFVALLTLVSTSASSADAAWNNVFQVTCFQNGTSTQAFSPCCPDPCPPACPQPVCETRYVQRCFYQPVTTYKQQVSYQPVTTYRTSYYYEPVTSYRYSCSYDPCTCSYRQVATPVVSYRLRSRCNAVTSYLQRCQMVPVTSYRQVTYYQPVTSCKTPACPTCPPAQAPAVNESFSTPPPNVGEGRSSEKPKVEEQKAPSTNPNNTSRFPSVPEQRMPGADGSTRSLPPVQPPHPSRPTPRAPRVTLDRVVALPKHNVEGQVDRANPSAPDAAKILFVSADLQGVQETVTADYRGRFRASLASGRWLVYVHDHTGRPVYQQKINVDPNGLQQVSLVSR